MDFNLPKMGRIYYNEILVKHDKVSYVEYVQNPTNFNFQLPTLIVGWNYVKSLNIKNNLNILDKKIKDILFWEFSFNEQKNNHINGVNNFAIGAPTLYFEHQYDYMVIDPIFNNIKNEEDLKFYFNSSIKRVYNYNNENLFILTNENKILGFNLLMFRFFKFNIDSILEKIDSSIIFNDNGDFFTNLCKKHNFMFDLKRYVVTIL